jgi:hypothetical protein
MHRVREQQQWLGIEQQQLHMTHVCCTSKCGFREASKYHSRCLPGCYLQATNTGFHMSGSTGNFTESNVRVLPTAEYLRANDLITHGEGPNDHVPEPYQTFECARFPADVLGEVRKGNSSAESSMLQEAVTLLLCELLTAYALHLAESCTAGAVAF